MRWICRCGHAIDDHICPDENRYVVYSDIDWDRTSQLTDSDNRIDWLRIPKPTYEAYRCPVCGRLIVFVEPDKGVFFSPEDDEG